MDIFNYIREQLYLEEGKFKKFIKDPLKYGAVRRALKHSYKADQKSVDPLGIPSASFVRSATVLGKRGAQAVKRTAAVAGVTAAGGTTAIVYKKKKKK